MATKSANMKGFYRQKKVTGGVGKAKAKAQPSKNKSKLSNNAATIASDVTQPIGLISHGSPDFKDDHDEHEDMLRQFDMNMAYGPCLGMNRMARWERAQRLGLNPPKEIECLLKSGKAQAECLWDGRV